MIPQIFTRGGDRSRVGVPRTYPKGSGRWTEQFAHGVADVTRVRGAATGSAAYPSGVFGFGTELGRVPSVADDRLVFVAAFAVGAQQPDA